MYWYRRTLIYAHYAAFAANILDAEWTLSAARESIKHEKKIQ